MFATALWVAAGCAPSSTPAPPTEFRYAWTSDPASLDPALAVDVVGGAAVGLVYEGLVTFDRDGGIAPGLARSWEASPDGRSWRFLLNENARDSAGRPIGSAEIVASFERLLSPDTASPRAWVLESIHGARAFRNGTADRVAGLTAAAGELRIDLEAPKAAFLGLLAMPNAAVIPTGGEVTGEIGTGPWFVEEHVRDSHLRFRRNPHWHGSQSTVETLYVRILPEEFTRVAEYEVGNLDLLEVPQNESARFREAVPGGGVLHRQIALVTEYIGLNVEDPVLRDPRVRRALNHAVNVDLILAQVLGGRGVRAVGAVPPTLPGGGAGQAYAYDPDRAKALLEEANVPADWTIELWQRPSPVVSQVLEAVQSDLAAVGIDAEIRLRDWSALKASIDRGEPSAFFVNWYADYPDAENFLVPLFHSRNIGGGGNRARLSVPEIDARLSALDQATREDVRAAAAAGLDRDVHALAPWIYLWHPALEVAVAPRVQGYSPHPIFSAERWLDLRLETSAAP